MNKLKKINLQKSKLSQTLLHKFDICLEGVEGGVSLWCLFPTEGGLKFQIVWFVFLTNLFFQNPSKIFPMRMLAVNRCDEEIQNPGFINITNMLWNHITDRVDEINVFLHLIPYWVWAFAGTRWAVPHLGEIMTFI